VLSLQWIPTFSHMSVHCRVYRRRLLRVGALTLHEVRFPYLGAICKSVSPFESQASMFISAVTRTCTGEQLIWATAKAVRLIPLCKLLALTSAPSLSRSLMMVKWMLHWAIAARRAVPHLPPLALASKLDHSRDARGCRRCLQRSAVRPTLMFQISSVLDR